MAERPPIRAVVFDYGAVICRLPSFDEWAEFAGAAGLSIGRLRVEAAHVLFVDDVAGNVEAAKTVGLQAAVFTSVGDLRRLLDSAV